MKFSYSPHSKFYLNKGLVFYFIVLTLCSGCISTGSHDIKRSHPQYNNVLASSLDQQLLNNIVRLKYRENPSFLEISNITESHTIGINAGLKDARIYKGMVAKDYVYYTPQALFSNNVTPTISYHPLRGQEFLQHLMTPLPFSAVLLMSQSGWKLERVFNLCIERINDVDNASLASGPTPRLKPEYEKFYKVTSLLQKLEYEHKLSLGLDTETHSALVLRFKDLPTESAEMVELREILNLDQDRDEFYFRDNFLSVSRDGLSVRMRSLMGVLFYLSHAVEVPQKDIDDGLVMTTVDADGNVFDWTKNASGTMIHIKSSTKYPRNAFIKTHYRGKWFYIEDNDLHSKSTFMFVSYLFNLQAGEFSGKAVSPILTIPATK